MKSIKTIMCYLCLLALCIQFSCNSDDFSQQDATTIKIEEESEIVATQVVSDSILLKIIEEEDINIELLKSGRLVDISGMSVPKTNPKKVLAHYMPWFQSKDYDGWWGNHWTMNNKNPDIMDADGKREIAAYSYPLIGPYSSKDPDLQEYHFLMMKLAGIDGVIFDWYGSRNFYDYGILKEATETFMWRMEDLGMDFSIMYEDRAAVQAAELGLASNKIEAAKQDFQYIKDTYFTSPNFYKHNNTNLMFVFGPHHIQEPAEWDEIFTVFDTEEIPDYLTLWAAKDWVGDHAAGEFLWVDKDHLIAHDYYYSWYPQFNKITVGSVYPGFKNFSEDGGWGLQHDWSIPEDSGSTFVETLNYTHHEAADLMQLITWNDFGEGTMIEPTEEQGFMYLQLLQEYTGVNYKPEDLQIPLDLYRLRKEFAVTNSSSKSGTKEKNKKDKVQKYLDRAYQHIKKGNMERAELIFLAIERFYK